MRTLTRQIWRRTLGPVLPSQQQLLPLPWLTTEFPGFSISISVVSWRYPWRAIIFALNEAARSGQGSKTVNKHRGPRRDGIFVKLWRQCREIIDFSPFEFHLDAPSREKFEPLFVKDFRRLLPTSTTDFVVFPPLYTILIWMNVRCLRLALFSFVSCESYLLYIYCIL